MGKSRIERDSTTAADAAAQESSAVDEWQPTRAFEPDRDLDVGAKSGHEPKVRVQPSPMRKTGLPEPWQPTRQAKPARRAPTETWQATRAQTALATQFFDNKEDYLAEQKSEIGRQTGLNQHELFVSCDAAQAMQQQFEHLRPEYIAVHEIGSGSSHKLLAGIAAASGRAVQTLVVRRQGYGTALATIEFIELPTTDGQQALRLYATHVDADTTTREALARTLLAFSRLGVVLVSALPAHVLDTALKPLHDAIVAGPWSNRNLLLLPLAATLALTDHGVALARGTPVAVRTAPLVSRPADAWGFITGTWNRLRQTSGPTHGEAIPQHHGDRIAPALAPFVPASEQRLENSRGPAMRGMPSGDTLTMDELAGTPTASHPAPAMLRMPGLRTTAGDDRLQRYAKQVSELNGVIGCCVFDRVSGVPLATATVRADSDAATAARHGSALLASIAATGSSLGLGDAPAEAAITFAAHHLLLRALPRDTRLALHAVLDKNVANLTLVRLQVARLDALFDEPTH